MRCCAGSVYSLVQIQSRKHILDRARYKPPTRQYELDLTDQEYICLERCRSSSGNRLSRSWSVRGVKYICTTVAGNIVYVWRLSTATTASAKRALVCILSATNYEKAEKFAKKIIPGTYINLNTTWIAAPTEPDKNIHQVRHIGTAVPGLKQLRRFPTVNNTGQKTLRKCEGVTCYLLSYPGKRSIDYPAEGNPYNKNTY